MSESVGYFTLCCPCGRTEANVAVPKYVSIEAAVAMAAPSLHPCPGCNQNPRPVPTSPERTR